MAPSNVSGYAAILVPTLINNIYNQQNHTILASDNGFLMETANARHAEVVTRLQRENREQMMHVGITASSKVAQPRLEHARLETQKREMEEVAASNGLAGRLAVAHHQMEAGLAAEQAQQLHERL